MAACRMSNALRTGMEIVSGHRAGSMTDNGDAQWRLMGWGRRTDVTLRCSEVSRRHRRDGRACGPSSSRLHHVALVVAVSVCSMVMNPVISLTSQAGRLAGAARNVRLMHALCDLGGYFERAGVDVMVLKGAALQVRLYERPDQRSMCDLDLMVRPSDLTRALDVMRQAGFARSQVLMRDDFFPRYYYEAEFSRGDIFPITVDLHVRPFRTLRYARLVPDDALWCHAVPLNLGPASLLAPDHTDMLLHMAVHWAIHGCDGVKWRVDLREYVRRYAAEIDWDRLAADAEAWRLTLPLREALITGLGEGDGEVPAPTWARLKRARVNWRDRLALAQAPRDNSHPLAHVAVNAMTTPGLRFVWGYLRAALIPGREHMRQWYGREHVGWLPVAHLARWTCRLTRWLRPVMGRLRGWELGETDDGRPTLLASRVIQPGQTIARYRYRATDQPQSGAILHEQAAGRRQWGVPRGMARFLMEDPSGANVRCDGRRLIALRRIAPGKPICVGPGRRLRIQMAAVTRPDVTPVSPQG